MPVEQFLFLMKSVFKSYRRHFVIKMQLDNTDTRKLSVHCSHTGILKRLVCQYKFPALVKDYLIHATTFMTLGLCVACTFAGMIFTARRYTLRQVDKTYYHHIFRSIYTGTVRCVVLIPPCTFEWT